jgi:hypothetical protein
MMPREQHLRAPIRLFSMPFVPAACPVEGRMIRA